MNENNLEKNIIDVKRVDQPDGVRQPPKPLTQKELDYYKRAREEAVQRKNQSNNQASSQETVQAEINQVMQAVKPETVNPDYAYMRPGQSAQEEVQKPVMQQQVQQKPVPQRPLSKREQAAEAQRVHNEKQRYYDSRYADTSSEAPVRNAHDNISYVEPSSEMYQREKKHNPWLSLISWLIFLLVFVLIGYGLSYLLFML